ASGAIEDVRHEHSRGQQREPEHVALALVELGHTGKSARERDAQPSHSTTAPSRAPAWPAWRRGGLARGGALACACHPAQLRHQAPGTSIGALPSLYTPPIHTQP